MVRQATFIGTIIFGVSFLAALIPALRLDFLDPNVVPREYFELFLIWITGIVGGLGMGYGSRESYGYGEGNNATIIGGLGLGAGFILVAWFIINDTAPLIGILVAAGSALLAIIGLYMVAVSTQDQY
jgi:hypothetical protein